MLFRTQTARILGNRSRKGKSPYEIADEYGVQDLLHAVLRGYLKYSVQEDPLPKVAGTKSSRSDISVEELGVLIEIKYVHGPEAPLRRVLSGSRAICTVATPKDFDLLDLQLGRPERR